MTAKFQYLQKGVRLFSALLMLAGFLSWGSTPAHAFVGDGVSSNIRLQDANQNGKIDRILIDVANPNTETWSLTGALPHGLSVFQAGKSITISNVTVINPTAPFVTVQIDLSEADLDLLFDTDGLVDNPLEVIYSQGNGGANCVAQPCVTDNMDEELNAIASIDTNPTNTEMDFAKPIIRDVQIEDTDANGLIDKITYTWTENIDTDDSVAPVAADLPVTWLPDVSAATFIGAVITDPAGLSPKVIVTNVGGQTMENTAVGGSSINGDLSTKWKDMSSGANTPDATAATASEVITDLASPIVRNKYYIDSNSDGKIDEIGLNFSENVTFTYDPADWNFGLPGTVNLSGDFNPAECSGSGSSVITCTDTGIGTIDAAANITGGVTAPRWDYENNDNVQDSSSNNMSTVNLTLDDLAPPVIKSAKYLDTNVNGAIDHVEFTTTADTGITCSSFTANTDFTVGTHGTVNVVSSGGDTCATNGTSTVTIALATPGTALTTGGSTSPVVTYTQPGNGVEDGVGNDMPTSAGVTVTDGAAPVYATSATIDSNGNGTVDYVKVVYSEPVDDSTVAATDYQSGMASTVVGNLIEAINPGTPGDIIDDNTIYVSVASGTETILSDKTDYTLKIQQVGAVSDANSNALASFASQDSTDGAGPVILSSAYGDSNSDGKVDQIVLNYSESTFFTMNGADWNFSTPSNMTFGGDFIGGDCSGSPGLTITCTDADNSGFTADPNETGVSVGAQPAWAFVTSSNITDNPGNKAVSQTTTLADLAKPLAINATIDYNDNAKNLLVNFTESVAAATTDRTKFHINNVTGVDNITPSTATTSADGTSLIFPLTEAERLAALLISGVTGGDAVAVVLDLDAGAVRDLSAGANVSIIDDNNTVTETADTHAPILSQWDLDYATNTLTLTFSETVKASTLTPTAITLQDAATAVSSYTLTGGTTASADGLAIVLDLTLTDVNAIKSMPGLAKTTANAFLRTTALLIDDIGTNPNTVIANGSALQAHGVTGVASFGDLSGSLNLSNNVINQIAKAGIYFQVQNNLPANGKIEITFPAVFNVVGAMSLENLSNIDGTFTVVPSGQTVTITRNNDGAVVTAGTNVNFKLVQVVNPSSTGTTAGFTFRTKNAANVVLDEDITVAGQTIILPTIPVSGSGGGGGSSSGGSGGGGFKAPPIFGLKTKTPATTPTESTTEKPAASEQPATGPAEPSSFNDITGHWAESYINQMADLGVVTGKTPTQFVPNDDISRAELLKIAVNAFGFTVPDAVTEKPLPDVEIGDWYAPYVKSAFDNNLIFGFADGFQPNSPATRGMSTTVLTKAAGFTDVDQNFTDNYKSHTDWSYAKFPDVPMNSYFAPSVAYLSDKGVVGGYEDGTYGPGNPITRAEIAKIVVKLLDLIKPVTEPATTKPAASAPAADAQMMDGQGLAKEDHPASLNCDSFPTGTIGDYDKEKNYFVCYGGASYGACVLEVFEPIEGSLHERSTKEYNMEGEQIGSGVGTVKVDGKNCLPTTADYFNSVVK